MSDRRAIEPTRVSRIVPAHLDQEALSVVVFGPGIGEAIVVRLPDGRVGVVDGCHEPQDPRGRGDPVREILEDFAQQTDDPASFRLAFVCLTHPHDDHYRGLGELLRAYRGRIDGVWTVAPISGRFVDVLPVSLRAVWAGKPIAKGDDEPAKLRDVIHEIVRTSQETRLRLLSASKVLMPRAEVRGAELEAVGWGPVDRDQAYTLEALKAALIQKTEGKRVSVQDPNVMSGAVLFRWGSARILLAGDLLRGAGPYLGWSGVVDEVEGPVQVVNVAHHASEEAHDPRLWEKLRPDLAIVTPFQHAAGNQPPRPDQLKKLLVSATVAVTSPPSWVGPGVSPRPLHHGVKRRASIGRALDAVPRLPLSAIHNAVGVSLDAAGQMTRFVLGGAADVYVD